MKQVCVAEILDLTLQERRWRVELIWESIAAVPETTEVTPQLKAEIDVRLKALEADPGAG